MHIPDNYLSPLTCAAMGAAMVPVWAVAARRVKSELTPAKVPMLGIGAAFSFLLMMFNVPLPGGTTGHAVGGTLVAVLIGPFSACIAVTVALLVQALLFGDGGILAFGANCFHMAFVLPFLGYYLHQLLRTVLRSPKGEPVALAIASYVGLNAAAFLTAVGFGLQPLLFRDPAGQPLYSPYPLSVSIPAMMIPHLLVAGFVEAAFTVSLYAYLARVSPGSVRSAGPRRSGALYGVVALLVCLTPLGLLAAGTAWGEWGIDELRDMLGYVPAGMAEGFSFEALLPDYTLPGMPDAVAYLLSAIAGVAVLLIVFKLAAAYLGDRKPEGPA